jgi:opacity protein-like surface antigen
MKKEAIVALVAAAAALPAAAKDVDIQPACNCQRAFESVSEDLVAAIDYRAVGPAEATGIIGIGLGLVGSYTAVDSRADWNTVTGENFSGLPMVGLQATKGLPLDLDVGVFYSTVPDTNIDVLGGELRYAILAGSTVSPALALRASYVTVSGIDDFDLESKGVDLSLSKGFAMVTPYAGVGYVWGEADVTDPTAGVSKAKVDEPKAYLGLRLSLGLLELTPEVGQVGDNTTYSLRMGFSLSL